MKKLYSLALVACMMVTMSACSSGSSDEKQKLTVSTFQLSEDVVKADVFKPFEEANNCEIVVDYGNASDRYTKLKNNSDGIDVIELNQSTAAKGYADGMFDKLTEKEVPSIANLIGSAKTMQSNSGYGPAYVIQSVGIIYDKEAVGFEIKDWSDLWKAELAGKIAIPDITTTNGPIMVSIASDYKGVNVKDDEGAAAFKALEELKPNVVKTYTKSSDLANMFAAKEISVAVVGDFAVPTIQKTATTTTFFVPESGTYANFNTIDVVSTSKNKELAQKFVDWRISQELQQKSSISLNEGPTNAKVELTEEQAKNMTYGSVAEKAKAVDYTVINPLLANWTDQWNRILNR